METSELQYVTVVFKDSFAAPKWQKTDTLKHTLETIPLQTISVTCLIA